MSFFTSYNLKISDGLDCSYIFVILYWNIFIASIFLILFMIIETKKHSVNRYNQIMHFWQMTFVNLDRSFVQYMHLPSDNEQHYHSDIKCWRSFRYRYLHCFCWAAYAILFFIASKSFLKTSMRFTKPLVSSYHF